MIPILSDAASLFLLWLFVLAGIHKCQEANADYYKEVVRAYGFESVAQSGWTLKLLGALELAAGLMIVVPATREFGAAAIAALLFFYLGLIATQLLKGKKDMECGCAGPLGGTKLGSELLLRNVGLLAAALFCVSNSASGLASANTIAITLAFSLLLILFYLCSEQLIANAQKLKLLAGR